MLWSAALVLGSVEPCYVPAEVGGDADGCGCRTGRDRALPLLLLVALARRRRCGKMKG